MSSMPSELNRNNDNGQPVFSELLDPGFWEAAFDIEAPFYDGYVRHLGPAVVEGLPTVIDYHWEGIYYAKDGAVGPIICRLVFIAAKYPEANFVESLAFFLSHEENTARLENYLKTLSIDLLKELIRVIDRLSVSLKNTGDDDLSDEFISFQQFLSRLVSSIPGTTKSTDD